MPLCCKASSCRERARERPLTTKRTQLWEVRRNICLFYCLKLLYSNIYAGHTFFFYTNTWDYKYHISVLKCLRVVLSSQWLLWELLACGLFVVAERVAGSSQEEAPPGWMCVKQHQAPRTDEDDGVAQVPSAEFAAGELNLDVQAISPRHKSFPSTAKSYSLKTGRHWNSL